MKSYTNKYSLNIITPEDFTTDDEYEKKRLERTLKRLNTLFGVVESDLKSMDSTDAALYNSNIVFNIFLRMNITDVPKEHFLEYMEQLYERGQELKTKWELNKQTA